MRLVLAAHSVQVSCVTLVDARPFLLILPLPTDERDEYNEPKTVLLWHPSKTQETPHTFTPHCRKQLGYLQHCSVNDIKFEPAGIDSDEDPRGENATPRIVTAGEDGYVRVWRFDSNDHEKWGHSGTDKGWGECQEDWDLDWLRWENREKYEDGVHEEDWDAEYLRWEDRCELQGRPQFFLFSQIVDELMLFKVDLGAVGVTQIEFKPEGQRSLFAVAARYGTDNLII